MCSSSAAQAGLCDFAVAGSEVTIVGEQRPPDFPDELDGRTLRWVEGSILERRAYVEAGVVGAHAVILGSLQAENYKDADARTLTSLLSKCAAGSESVSRAPNWGVIYASFILPGGAVVQDIVNGYNGTTAAGQRPPHIVACIQAPETVQTAGHVLRELARRRLTAELLQPGTMVTGMLLQVAHEPLLADALSELIDTCKGNEVYLRRPERYGLNASSRPHSFAALCELARFRGETCLGFVTGDGKLVLAPDASHSTYLGKDARIVVLAFS